MWNYEKRLQFPVNIKKPDARAAMVVMSQYGGPDGELGASLRYLSQRYSMPYSDITGLLTDRYVVCLMLPHRSFGSNAEFSTTFHLCGSKFK